MLISTLRLEAKALKAFREDPETSSDSEEDEAAHSDRQSQAEGGTIELGNIDHHSADNASSKMSSKYHQGSSKMQYMGGEKERSGKKRNKKEQGCFERLLRMSESRNSQFGGSGAN